ncbi:MAG: XRE family transcriptional regulator [Clostridia bacterium]|nr:XRE family transcriptional regulator [Clostridia bacterium]
MSDSKQLFARNLKLIRQSRNLSQVKLAELLSYTGKAVSKWESGSALPPAEVLPRLAKVLNTDLNSLFNFREDPSYFLGVDGGGTKTKFMLTDSKGSVLKQLVKGPCNPTSVGIDTAVSVLTDGIKEICQEIPFGKVSVFIGSAGCGIEANRQTVTERLMCLNLSQLSVNGDGDNIISAGLKGQNGIVAIIGTGSIIYSVINKKRYRIGGYGHFIGDTFSGTEIGRGALEAVLAELDKSGEHTSLTDIITAKVGTDISKILTDMYVEGKTYMAQFAFSVFEEAANGDKVAKAIIDRNVDALSSKLAAALKNFPETSEVPVILAGGITHFADRFVDEIKSKIKDKRLKSIEILDCEPVIGAVLLAGAPEVKENENA